MEYLSQIGSDMERFKLNKAGRDVQEIQEYLFDAQTALEKAMNAARGTIPPSPLHQRGMVTANRQTKSKQTNGAMDDPTMAQEFLGPMDLGDLSKHAYL